MKVSPSMTPDAIRSKLNEFLDSSKAAAFTTVRDRLLETGNTFVLFGGAARDITLHGAAAEPRDFDLVITSPGDRKKLRTDLREWNLSFNAFGGFAFKIGNVDFDGWRIEDTMAFRHTGNTVPVTKDILSSSFFNIEAILLEFPGHEVYDGGFSEGFETRVLEVNFEYHPLPGLCLLRTASFVKRFGFTIGPKLGAWIHEHRTFMRPATLLRIQNQYYKKVVVTEEEIVAILSPFIHA